MSAPQGAPQPYELPRGWTWKTLGTINTHKSHSVTPANSPNTMFELYSVPSFQQNYPEIVRGAEIGSSKQGVEKGDVLLCKINPRINRVWQVYQYTSNESLASSEWIVVRNADIDSNYLMWYFRSPVFRKFLMSNVSGVGGSLMRAQPKYVKGYPVPLPPAPEQKRIVARIEALFAKLDAAEEKVDAVLSGAALRRAAILHEAVSGKLTASWRQNHGIAADSWKTVALEDCGQWTGGGTPSKSHLEYWENGDIMWVTSKDVKTDWIEDTPLHITSTGVEHSSAKYIDKAALLFVMRSGILRHSFPVSMVKPGFTVNQDLKVLIPNDSVYLPYLFYAMRASEQKVLNTCMKSGTTVESINTDALKKFEVHLPGLDEQREIARRLDALFSKERQAEKAARAAKAGTALLRKSILVKAFRGAL